MAHQNVTILFYPYIRTPKNHTCKTICNKMYTYTHMSHAQTYMCLNKTRRSKDNITHKQNEQRYFNTQTNRKQQCAHTKTNLVSALNGAQSGCDAKSASPTHHPCTEQALAPQQSQSTLQRPGPNREDASCAYHGLVFSHVDPLLERSA